MQFQFGDQAFEAQNEAPVDGGRIVNAVLIADETGAKSAQIEQLIPVGAVPRQARDIVSEDDAHLFLVDECDEFLKTEPSFRRPTGAAEIGIDNADLAGFPTGGAGTVLEVILKSQAFLVVQRLVPAGLANVHDGQTLPMNGLD